MQKSTKPTEYRKELKGKILITAMNLFCQHGIRRVKMDDIAASLGISKRTLYEIFPNKEDMLLEGIEQSHAAGEAYLHSFLESGQRSTMDILIEVYRKRMEELSVIPPVFLSDIGRYPRVLEYLNSKHVKAQDSAIEFFQKGIDEGYFRPDVDYTLMVRLGDSMMQNALERNLYKEYKLPYLFRNILFLFMRGFCTSKGLEILDETLKDQSENSSTHD
ncbi:MAG: TetR/AcrR family transcriptional regulator [Prevotella sp.]|nr:TetR/AcrR family transcriptional regulator [Prevotella sp.]